jgi:hypothetical protein
MPNGLPSFDGYEGATALQEVAGERTAAYCHFAHKTGQSGSLLSNCFVHCVFLLPFPISQWLSSRSSDRVVGLLVRAS